TMESRLSRPDSALDFTGTPSTGRVVIDATIPGRCAAPPAPAMITLIPRPRASLAYRTRRSGVRWAETTLLSWATPSSVRICAASRMVGQSDRLPITIPTSAVAAIAALQTVGPDIRGPALGKRRSTGPDLRGKSRLIGR